MWYLPTAVAASRDTDPTETVRLLAAMREVFDRLGDTWVKTEDMLRELKLDVGEPWARSSFEASKLADGLKGHKITSHQHRFPENKRGYTREDFENTWKRYVPSPGRSVTADTATDEPGSGLPTSP